MFFTFLTFSIFLVNSSEDIDSKSSFSKLSSLSYGSDLDSMNIKNVKLSNQFIDVCLCGQFYFIYYYIKELILDGLLFV
jgi:hypothetical protein